MDLRHVKARADLGDGGAEVRGVGLARWGVVDFATGYREPDDRREVFFLRTLCVRPESQGTGVGSRLIGHLKEHLGKSGVNTIYLIPRKGIPAERFYGKHGYEINDEDIVMTHEW